MGRGNVCVTGKHEGLYYIDNDHFHVYRRDEPDSDDEFQTRLLRDLSYEELTGGEWHLDEWETEEEKDDILDELIDRFGEPPQSVCNLLDIALLKVKAHENFITAVAEKPGGVRITMYPQAEVAPEKIPPLVGEFGKRLRFVPDTTPYFVYIPQGDGELLVQLDYVVDRIGEIKRQDKKMEETHNEE